MATGALKLIAETEITSAVSSVTLTGIDGTYDNYAVSVENVTGGNQLRMRVTQSGSVQTGSNYQMNSLFLRSYSAFSTFGDQNVDHYILGGFGSGATENINCWIELYNFPENDSSFFVVKNSLLVSSGVAGFVSAGLHKVNQINDGVNFFKDSGTTSTGVIKLYGYQKQ